MRNRNDGDAEIRTSDVFSFDFRSNWYVYCTYMHYVDIYKLCLPVTKSVIEFSKHVPKNPGRKISLGFLFCTESFDHNVQ